MKTVLFAALLSAIAIPQAHAGQSQQVLFYDGTCDRAESYIKVGDPSVDFANIIPTVFRCDAAVLMLLANGRRIIQFVDRDSGAMPLGLAGPEIDRHTNAKMAILPIDHYYAQRKTATAPAEGAEGFCFFDKKNLAAVKQINCVAKVESSTKTVIKFVFNVTHVTEKKL